MEKKKLKKDPKKEESSLIGEKPPSKKNRTWKVFGVIFSIVLLIIIILFTFLGWYVQTFSQTADTSSKEIITSLKNGVTSNPFENKDEINLLLLGKDNIGIGRDNSNLTDTIIIFSIQKTGQIAIIPIPRDLWIDPLKSKINALYHYGEKSEDITGVELTSKSIEEISGLSIDHTIVMNLDLLEEIIDSVDGITVNVINSFTDEKFPNNDVPPDILPVELRYKTVSFESGVQQMDGDKAIEYIRSRQSENKDENTDNARSARQQQVIKSIINKITSKNIIFNPTTMGRIYYQWGKNTQTSISDEYLISLGRYLLSQDISYKTLSIPVQNTSQKGILYNPPLYVYNQWVYLPHDISWQELQNFIYSNLHPGR